MIEAKRLKISLGTKERKSEPEKEHQKEQRERPRHVPGRGKGRNGVRSDLEKEVSRKKRCGQRNRSLRKTDTPGEVGVGSLRGLLILGCALESSGML